MVPVAVRVSGARWIGVSAFVKQAALRPRLQVLRRTRSCRRTSGYCPLWSWHPPLRIEERDGGAKAALLQSFADNGVRPVLRGRIKSNQMPKWDPALINMGPAIDNWGPRGEAAIAQPLVLRTSLAAPLSRPAKGATITVAPYTKTYTISSNG